MSALLTAAGVPCGHEAAHSNVARGVWPEGLLADSSWMAACMLDVVTCPVVLLVRHPLAVVRSWVEIGFFTHDIAGPTHGPLRQAYPHVYDYAAPHDRALAMWTELTTAALRRAELVVRLEQLLGDSGVLVRLLRWAGHDTPQAVDAHRTVGQVNRKEHLRRLTLRPWTPSWDAHEAGLARGARWLTESLGYDPEVIGG